MKFDISIKIFEKERIFIFAHGYMLKVYGWNFDYITTKDAVER